MTLPQPEGLSLDTSVMIAYLGELHAQQLTQANIEAAKWRAVAARAGAELAELRQRITTLEQAHGTVRDRPDDMIGEVE